MKKYTKITAATVAGILAAGTAIAEDWDMPMHTQQVTFIQKWA